MCPLWVRLLTYPDHNLGQMCDARHLLTEAILLFLSPGSSLWPLIMHHSFPPQALAHPSTLVDPLWGWNVFLFPKSVDGSLWSFKSWNNFYFLKRPLSWPSYPCPLLSLPQCPVKFSSRYLAQSDIIMFVCLLVNGLSSSLEHNYVTVRTLSTLFKIPSI